MSATTISAKCANCGKEVNPKAADPCPECGAIEKNVIVTASETINISVSHRWKVTREFWEKHWGLIILVVALTAASSTVGTVIAGPWGTLAGAVLGFTGFFLGFKAVTKVQHTKQGS